VLRSATANPGLAALVASGAVFATAAAVLGVATVLVRDRAKVRDAWTVYGLQFLTMGAILVPAYVGGIVFTAAVAAIAALALLELLGVQKEPVPVAMKVAAVAFGTATCVLATYLPFPALYLTVPLAASALLVANLFFPNDPRHLQGLSSSLLGIVYVPVFLSHLLVLRKLDGGFMIVFFMYGLAEVNDSFAYLLGKLLGRKKIFPSISPNKTWVGFASGIVVAAVAGFAANATLIHFPAAFAAAVVPTIICCTVLGDLVSSKIKRDLGVKDFGSLIPRTGGVLDCYDSLVFISPFVYFVARLAC
jgi:phosphatidate cytidylyltransferase